jgi:hypothetical protein
MLVLTALPLKSFVPARLRDGGAPSALWMLSGRGKLRIVEEPVQALSVPIEDPSIVRFSDPCDSTRITGRLGIVYQLATTVIME